MGIALAYVLAVLPEMSLIGIASFVSAGAIIFGGIIPYIPQYRTIRKMKSAEGFSTLVCFVLLLANLLRVFFWFGKRFELPLLVQSLIMIIAMMVMVELCVRVKNQSEIIQSRQHSFRGFASPSEFTPHTFYQSFTEMDWSHFWQWTDFLSYVECMLVLGLLFSMSTYLLIDYSSYVETVGFLAVFIEAMLGTPQLYRNYTSGSTAGMSVSMVLMWLSGDIFKTVYFVVKEQPMQFWLCGVVQISVDIAILAQVLYYTLYPRIGTSRHAR